MRTPFQAGRLLRHPKWRPLQHNQHKDNEIIENDK